MDKTFTARHSRRSFGQAVRRAKRLGTLRAYDRTYCGHSRVATMRDGTVEIYHPPSYYYVAVNDPESPAGKMHAHLNTFGSGK